MRQQAVSPRKARVGELLEREKVVREAITGSDLEELSSGEGQKLGTGMQGRVETFLEEQAKQVAKRKRLEAFATAQEPLKQLEGAPPYGCSSCTRRTLRGCGRAAASVARLGRPACGPAAPWDQLQDSQLGSWLVTEGSRSSAACRPSPGQRRLGSASQGPSALGACDLRFAAGGV